jgi:hypothetical protein
VFTVYRVFNSNTIGMSRTDLRKKEIIFYNPSHHSLPTNRNVSTIQYSRISSVADPGPDGFASRKLDQEPFF